MAPRKNVSIARVGNYAAPVDSTDDPALNTTLFGGTPKPMDKTESDYVGQAKNKATATEAVRRARKANKVAPLPGD
jgi:hypothetical protein